MAEIELADDSLDFEVLKNDSFSDVRSISSICSDSSDDESFIVVKDDAEELAKQLKNKEAAIMEYEANNKEKEARLQEALEQINKLKQSKGQLEEQFVKADQALKEKDKETAALNEALQKKEKAKLSETDKKRKMKQMQDLMVDSDEIQIEDPRDIAYAKSLILSCENRSRLVVSIKNVDYADERLLKFMKEQYAMATPVKFRLKFSYSSYCDSLLIKLKGTNTVIDDFHGIIKTSEALDVLQQLSKAEGRKTSTVRLSTGLRLGGKLKGAALPLPRGSHLHLAGVTAACLDHAVCLATQLRPKAGRFTLSIGATGLSDAQLLSFRDGAYGGAARPDRPFHKSALKKEDIMYCQDKMEVMFFEGVGAEPEDESLMDTIKKMVI